LKKILLLLLNIGVFAENLITPLPTFENFKYNNEKALLGKKLFNDTRLSKDNTISCASCHLLEEGGDNNSQGSYGIYGQYISRNVPTVFNAYFNIHQHWDASSKNLEDQARDSIEHPLAMQSNFHEVLPKLMQDKDYKEKFKKIYQEKISKKTVLNAIAEFEKALITPNSKFDKHLKGNLDILNDKEKNGYKLFKDYGCISCHNGINIGGNLIQKIGVINKYKTDDLGRYEITKNINDKYYFKVPSLRNIALTAPYFHDGKIKTLQDAVKQMSILQVGYPISKNEINDMVLFLKTLTGETPNILKGKQ
jgi:cytochrome c peroxidase